MSCKQNVLVLTLHECTKKKTSTIPLIQLFVLYIQLTPDNMICARNIELEIVESLDFILDQYKQNKQTTMDIAAERYRCNRIF